MQVNALDVKNWKDALKTLKLLSVLPDKDVLVSLTAAAGGGLLVQCQTPNASFRLSLEAEVDQTGTVVVPRNTIDKLSYVGKTMKLSSASSQLDITCGRFKYTLATAEKNKAVSINEVDTDAVGALQLPCGTLQHALTTTWFGQGEDGGEDVRVIMGNGKLIVEAADALRCAYCYKTMPTWKDAEPRVVVLKKAVLSGLLKNFEKTDILALHVVKNKSLTVSDGAFQIELPLVTATALYPVRKEIKAHVTRLEKKASASFETKDVKGVSDGITSILSSADKSSKTRVELQLKKDRMLIKTADDDAKFSTTLPISSKKDSDVFKVSNKHFSSFLSQAISAGDKGELHLWGKDLVTLEFISDTDKVVYALPLVVN